MKEKKYRLKNGCDYVMFEESDFVIYGKALLYDGAWIAIQHERKTLKNDNNLSSDLDLVEIKPYEDFKIDEPVYCWDVDYHGNIITCIYKGYFAGVSLQGKAKTFSQGRTSFSRPTIDEIDEFWDVCVKKEDYEKDKK